MIHKNELNLIMNEKQMFEKTYNFWLEWWLHFFVLYFFPRNSPKKWMHFNIFFSCMATTQTLLWTFCKKLENKAFFQNYVKNNTILLNNNNY